MSRPLRIEFEGGVYHVTARGNARSDIYLVGYPSIYGNTVR